MFTLLTFRGPKKWPILIICSPIILGPTIAEQLFQICFTLDESPRFSSSPSFFTAHAFKS